MKFGFEHDREDEGSAQVSEQTPLLANGNVAPTSDPAVAEATTKDRSSEASTIAENTTPSRSDNSSTTAAANSGENEDQANSDKPLPVTQILLLCFARVCEPLAFFCIFPFINQMCARNGNLQPADTGFYSGLIESLFSLTQMLVMIIWGRLADRFGRKPILVISMCGVAVFTGLFGAAQTIWQMIMFRCLAGVFSAAVITIRTMIAEHSTQKTQARAYSWFAFAGNMGILIGPLLGGALADPAAQYGGSFARSKFFRHYPYALATMSTGIIALIAAVVVTFFVEETLPPKHTENRADKDDLEAEPLFNSSTSKPEPDNSTKALLKAPGVVPVLYLSSHINVLAFSYTAIVPVFWYEPVRLGGFEFSSLYISLFMGLTGAAQAIWLLLVFPPLQHRIGTGGVLRICAYAYPFFFLVCPLLQLLLREGSHGARVTFWVVTPILLCVGVGVSMCFTAIQLAINDVSPSPRMLGTLNALALTLSSGIRAFSPAAFTSLFAVGVRKQILWGYLAWAVMIVIAAGFAIAIRWLPPNAEGKIKDNRRTANHDSHNPSAHGDNEDRRP